MDFTSQSFRHANFFLRLFRCCGKRETKTEKEGKKTNFK